MSNIITNTVWTLTAVALCALAPAASADTASKEESIGVGAGAVIGAVAGGPVGFIIGAGIGAKLGDTIDNKDDAIDSLESSLDESQTVARNLAADINELESDIDRMTVALDRAERVARPEFMAMLTSGIALDFSFRTDEHVLTDQYGSRLWTLAQALANNPQIHVRLDGFADERGAADYNQRLSSKRVDFVREQLIAAGVSAARIQTAAHGESPAVDDQPDSYALERRVSLTLYLADDAEAVAAN